MTATTTALSAALIQFVWQGTLVGGLLWAALFVLRRRSANARYVACCAGLLIMAVAPAVTAATIYLRAIPSVPPADAVGGISQTLSTAWNGSTGGSVSWRLFAQAWILPIWSFGVILCSIRPILGWKHALSLGRRGTAADASIVSIVVGLATRMGVHRPVRVLICAADDLPGVVGAVRPVILLPAAAVLGLSAEQLEAILAH